MLTLPYLTDAAQVATASDLVSTHGAAAAQEAATRAARSRDAGNHIHFCRWRQIGRLIALLQTETAQGTVH